MKVSLLKLPHLLLPTVQVWLQDFAWTEKDVPKKLKTRAAKLPDSSTLASEPIFCFELAIRLFYWSCLVYTYEEASPAPVPSRCTCVMAVRPSFGMQ